MIDLDRPYNAEQIQNLINTLVEDYKHIIMRIIKDILKDADMTERKAKRIKIKSAYKLMKLITKNKGK